MMSSLKTTILFLAADPTNAARLRLGQEFRDIQERLRLAKLRDEFLLVERTSVRPGDITQAIFDTEPSIIHFAGHGTRRGELCFEDELGKYYPVASEALEDLFELLSDQIKCVILNACYSDGQAKAIARHIDYVIGMNDTISDKAAITFVTGFYKALLAGKAIEKAYQFGLVELKLLNIPDSRKPVLIRKSEMENVVSTVRIETHSSEVEDFKKKVKTLMPGAIVQHFDNNTQAEQKLTVKLKESPLNTPSYLENKNVQSKNNADANLHPRMLLVTLKTSGDKTRDVLRLRIIHGVIISYPGSDQFAFQLFEKGAYSLVNFPLFTTGICQDLLNRLIPLVGLDNIRVEPIIFA